MKSDLLCLMWLADQKFWRNTSYTNKYYATIIILGIAILSAYIAGATMLNGMFDWDIEPSLKSGLLVGTILWIALVAESIICCTTIQTMALRSLWVTGIVIGTVALSALLSVVIITIVTIIVCLILLVFGIKVLGAMASGGGGNGSKYKLDDGTTVKKTGSGLFGEQYYSSSDGRKFEGSYGSDRVREL